MADLETIKVVLRSLLISSARVMTVFDLQRDYRQNEGHECPFVALGYKNFTSFLQSIPDTVTVLCNGTVKAVTNQDTAHIARLVALQKKGKKRRASSGYGRSSSAGSYRSSYAASYRSSSASSYRGSSYGSSVPPRFQETSYSTNRSYPSGSLSADRSYSESYSAPRTSQPASRSNSDHHPSPSYTIEKHFELVREVKEQARRDEIVREVKEQARREAFTSPISRSATPDEAGWSGEAFINNWKKHHKLEGSSQPRRINIVPELSSDESGDSFYERFKDEEDKVYVHSGKHKSEETKPVLYPDLYFESSDTINDKLKSNLKHLIKSYPKGLMACVLPEKYKEKYGVSLQWNELGYNSIIQMAHDLKDIIVCKRVQCGDWKLYDASLPIENSDVNVTQPAPTVPDAVKSKIYKIVKKYTSGIRIEQLVQLYQECYGKSLPSESPGFDTAESLFLSLHDTIVHLRYIRKECYIYPHQQPAEEVTLPPLEVDTDSKIELGLYPDEVLGPNEFIPPAELPPNLEPGDYIELRVAEVYNPHKFWIMLREQSLKLDSLMDELQDFYLDHGAKYAMPDSTIAEEQYCTAVYEGEWHRATIKSVGETIEVMYVDYGTTAKVSRTDLRFIHRDFCVLPSQAIRATMSGIQPPNGRQRFTREANHAMLQLVTDKHLIGFVQKLDREEPFVELFLIDTTGETDIHLNDIMVSQNHAAYKSDLLETTDQLQEIQIQEKTDELPSNQDLSPTSALPHMNSLSNISPNSLTSAPNISTTTCSPQSATNVTSSMHPQPPPPGFSASVGQTQAVPPALHMAGMGAYGANMGLHMLNPALAGYPASFLPQMNAALLMQQQQQLLAYYQNLYQQSMAASLLAAQSKMAAAAATAGGLGGVSNNPWLGSPFMHPQYGGFNTQSPLNISNPSRTYNVAERSTDCENTPSEIKSTPGRESANEFSSRGLNSEMAESVCASRTSVESNSKQLLSSSSDYSTSTDDLTVKKKITRKKRSERRPSTPRRASSPIVLNKLKVTHQDEKDPSNFESYSSYICRDLASGGVIGQDVCGQPASRVSPLLSDVSDGSFPESNSCEHLDQLMDMEDSDSASSCHNNAPDLVRSVANLNLSHQNTRNMTNFWKVVDIQEQSLHLFNVDQRAYVSTGELARKFTNFSSSDTLVRVLKSKGISVPYKKATRQEKLPLFSALDGYSERMLQCFDLVRNKNGSVVGTFHLTPLANVPSVLIPLDSDIGTVKEFQVLRDLFNPDESYWTQ